MLDFICALTITGSSVVVRYHVVNAGDESVFVAHVPIDATSKPYPNLAYSAVSADGQRLNLILGTSPRPTDREVERGISALFVELPRGEQMSGEIQLPVPAYEWHAYQLRNEDVETELVSVNEIVLSIELIPQENVTRVHAAKAPPGHWWVVGDDIKRSCRLTTPSPLAVLKRSGNFPRW